MSGDQRGRFQEQLGLCAGEGTFPGPFPYTGSVWWCQLCWNCSQSTPGVCNSSPNVQWVVTDKQFLQLLHTGCICTLFYNPRLGVVVVHVSCDQLVGHKLWNKLSSLGLSGWERKPQSLLQLLVQTTSHCSVLSLFRHLLIVVRAGCMGCCTGPGSLVWLSTPVMAQKGFMVAATTWFWQQFWLLQDESLLSLSLQPGVARHYCCCEVAFAVKLFRSTHTSL